MCLVFKYGTHDGLSEGLSIFHMVYKSVVRMKHGSRYLDQHGNNLVFFLKKREQA